MNLNRINEIRAGLSLAPLTARDTRAQKRAQESNHAVRAQANRDMKAKRGTRGK